MLIGALGHGTYSVVMDGIHILIDPLLTPTFLRGTSEPFPRRTVDLAIMPPVDAVFLTHSHPGHLEPESLDLLPRATPIFAPVDPTIALVLGKLGFSNTHVVRTGIEVSLGSGTLRFIGGDGYASAVFDDADARFWYLGDRGDFTSPGVIDATVAARPVDVALVSHPSDFHSYLQHTTWNGGAQDREAHEAWLARSLQTALNIGARLTVPGSTSNRYIGVASWLNSLVFPMRPEEFVTQLGRVDPGLTASVLDPGDVIIVRGGDLRIERDKLPYVRRLASNDDRGLDPTAAVPPVVDRNPEGLPREVLELRCEEYLLGTLAPWAAECAGPFAGELRRMHRHGLAYRVIAVFDNGSSAQWRLFLQDGKVEVSRQAIGDPACYGDLTLRVPASTLDRWSRNVIPYYEAGLDCRRAGCSYVIGRRSDGTVTAEPAHFRDLVTLHLTSSTERHHEWMIGTYWPDHA